MDGKGIRLMGNRTRPASDATTVQVRNREVLLTDGPYAETKDQIAGIYADGRSRIVATMIRFTGGDWDLAEECAQDAFARALRRWPVSGVPQQPLAWLTTTARRLAWPG